MLAKAKEKQLYDDLIEADIVSYLMSYSGSARLIIAADVLVYLSDLQPLFRSIRKSLDRAGHFIATIELGSGKTYNLTKGRRYAHSLNYLHEVTAQNSFIVQKTVSITLRLDENQPIEGVIFAAVPQ